MHVCNCTVQQLFFVSVHAYRVLLRPQLPVETRNIHIQQLLGSEKRESFIFNK